MKGTDNDGTSFPVSLINPSTNLSSETALGIVNFTFKVSVPLAGTITLFLSNLRFAPSILTSWDIVFKVSLVSVKTPPKFSTSYSASLSP